MPPQITLLDHVGNPLAYDRPSYSSCSVPWGTMRLHATGVELSAPPLYVPETRKPLRSRRVLLSQGETRPGFKQAQHWGYLDHVR